MSGPLSLTDEYVYRVAPDGKSVQAALGLVQRGAFHRLRMLAGGTRLEARCQDSDPKPYSVRVDLSDPRRPQMGCNCASPKHPCKHSLGLLFLAARSPEAFEQDESTAARHRTAAVVVAPTRARAMPAEKVPRAPADVGEALLQAVLAEPEEEGLRLIYADWLDENGEPDRAEFIRVQVELARGEAKGPRLMELKAREKALWEANREAWLKSLPPHLREKGVHFHKGFLEELSVPPRAWGKHGKKLFDKHPIYRVRLSGTVDRDEAGAFAVVPYLSRVKVLVMAGCRFREPLKVLQMLFSTPFLTGVVRLDLSGAEISTREVGVLVESPLLARLRELDLSDTEAGPKGVQGLAGSAKAAGLRELSLANAPVGDAGAKALAASPHLEGLARLDLSGVPLGEGAKEALRARFGERVVLG